MKHCAKNKFWFANAKTKIRARCLCAVKRTLCVVIHFFLFLSSRDTFLEGQARNERVIHASTSLPF